MVFNAHTQNHGKLQNNVVDLADLVIPEDGSLWKRRGDALLPLDVVGPTVLHFPAIWTVCAARLAARFVNSRSCVAEKVLTRDEKESARTRAAEKINSCREQSRQVL